MGHKLSNLLKQIFSKSTPEVRVVMLGLDNAGKTTILYQLKLERDVRAVPTIGFNVETVRFLHLILNIWDVSGRPGTRKLWEHYNRNTDAIIYVVDAADPARFAQATEDLHWLLCSPQLEQAKVLLFANKHDLPAAVGTEALAQYMQMDQYKRPWAVQASCATAGWGLDEGLEQLQRMLHMRKH